MTRDDVIRWVAIYERAWLRFAEDGRAEFFEEWAYWPDKPYSAGDASA